MTLIAPTGDPIVAPGGAFDTHDVEWCRRDEQYYWHLSGGGPRPHVDGITVWSVDDGTPPPPMIDLDDGEAKCVWCMVCDDWLPDIGAPQPCEHVAWCDECGAWNVDCADPCGCLVPDGWRLPLGSKRPILYRDGSGELRAAIPERGVDDYWRDGWWWVDDPSLAGMAADVGLP